jgi:hypothetical protein
MKSIQNQYNDLKEGKMSQANFMRNLRMTMPQYVTNITSFKDSVRILKNKGLLHESYGGFDEEEIVDEMNMEVKPEESNDAEFDAILKQLEDEMAGEIAVKSDVLDKPLEEAEGVTADAVAVEKAIKDKKIDPAVVKTAAEKAMRGDSTELALLMVNAGNLRESKGKELHPNLIHPGELRMGIRVEMEHTDDIETAKKIALDHIAENPYYYTALKLSGIESPTKPKEKAKKEVKSRKKKETVELIDKANQMQKVKMPKTVKEAMEVNPQGQLQPKELPAAADVDRILKFMKANKTFLSLLKNLNSIKEFTDFFRELLQLTDPELDALKVSDAQLQSIFRKSVLDKRKEEGVPNQIFSKNANIQKGINDIGGIKEAEQPTEDKIEMELASALSQQPTIKRILQKVDLSNEVTGLMKAVMDRANLKNIPDALALAAFRKVLNDQPGPTFTSQLAANANIGGPNPKIGKTLEEKLRLMVREVLAEEAPSKKNAASEITAKAVDYIDDYNEGESKEYKKSQLENVFDSYEDKVGRRFDDSVFEDVIDMLKAKGYTMAMKETFDGRDNLTNISDDTQE